MSLSLFVKGDIINSIYLTGLLQYKEKIIYKALTTAISTELLNCL